ncbi:hypothetical protein [Helicobacter pylori]|uniref:hypothetical protein n=1 Tax=Helicobacter pylori TaxID=210 RepID=UPI001FCFE8FD|nr:hypothetical protein [Helicobacter pylori]UOR28767.1 hypothetical protein MPG39_04375 [Helicobacter pylori]
MGKTFTMHQHVYEPIFKALKDHSMVSAHHKRKAAFNELVDVIVNLKTQGSLQVAQEKSAIEQAKHSRIDSTKPLLKKTNTPIT